MAELGIRNVRNFWLQADTDGRTPIALGPKSREGGLRATLYLREHGAVSDDKVEIYGTVGSSVDGDEGMLITEINVPADAVIEENSDGTKTITIRKER